VIRIPLVPRIGKPSTRKSLWPPIGTTPRGRLNSSNRREGKKGRFSLGIVKTYKPEIDLLLGKDVVMTGKSGVELAGQATVG